MVFSTNQVRQFYVVKKNETGANIKGYSASLPATGHEGETALLEFDDWGQHQDPKTYEFIYVNALGELGHSDLIHRENIRKVSFTPAAKLRMYLPTITVTNSMTAAVESVGVALSGGGTSTQTDVDTDMADNSKYATGDVFYMNFTFPGFLNATDEEIETKTVAMRYNYNINGTKMSATSTDPNYNANINDWGAQMADAITYAFNKKHNLDNDLLSASGTGSTVTIVGKAGQPWYVGVADNKPNQIVIDNLTMENWHNTALGSLPIENNSRVFNYGTAADVTGPSGAGSSNYVGNGKMTADLEYFCMGERGDQYRNVGWPNVIHTKYMINDPSNSAEYDYLDIHYYFQGEGVRSDKSEKQLTLVCTAGSGYLTGFYNTLTGSTGMLDVEDQLPTQTNSGTSSGAGGTGGEQTVQYTLTASSNDDTKGTVSASPSSNDGKYDSGTSVTLTASPESGYTFSKWTVDGTDSAETGPLTITMSADHTVVATFA